jgi:hypothetical protein
MSEDAQKVQSATRNTVTMSGSEWSVATYGIVEFLRVHPIWRALVAVFGIVSGLAYVATFAGLTFPKNFSGVVFLFLTPWLLWAATVSGPAFQLVFPSAEASKERQIAEKQFEQSRTPEDALNLDFTRLNEYYVINQAQARSSFRWALFSMFIGFGTIIAGIWLFYFRTTKPDTFMASLSTAAGCVGNFISAMFLYLHSKTQDRSLHYYQQLARLQQVSLAIRLVDDYKDPEKQTEARNLVIKALLSESNEKSTKDPKQESISP